MQYDSGTVSAELVMLRNLEDTTGLKTITFKTPVLTDKATSLPWFITYATFNKDTKRGISFHTCNSSYKFTYLDIIYEAEKDRVIVHPRAGVTIVIKSFDNNKIAFEMHRTNETETPTEVDDLDEEELEGEDLEHPGRDENGEEIDDDTNMDNGDDDYYSGVDEDPDDPKDDDDDYDEAEESDPEGEESECSDFSKEEEK